MNMDILISINRKVSRSVVGVSLSVLYAKRRGGYFLHIYSLCDIHMIFSYNLVWILIRLKYSSGLVPFIVNHVIHIFVYMHVNTFWRIFISKISLNRFLRDGVGALRINYPERVEFLCFSQVQVPRSSARA